MTTSADVFDVCVVGAGVEGSSTARYLASRGKKTLLLEQFPLPHSRGGSHGHSRIVRYGYPEAFFSALMPEAFQMWDEIEKKSGRALIRKCGLLTIDGPPFASVSKVISNVRHVGQECVQLTADEINRRFPGFAVSSDEYGALEPSSGLVQADLAIKTLQEQFVEFGGILHDSEKVLDIQPGSIVKIQTTKSFYKAKSVVITVGAWVNRVLKPLGVTIPLRIERISVCYWPVTEPHLYSPEKFPAFIFYAPLGRRDMHVYGLPVFEYPGLIKICAHKGTEISNPDCRDGHTKQDDVNIERVAEVIKTQIPGVKPELSIVETCMYALTPDHVFVLDRHPEFQNIIIGVVSGHGFKMAPVVGKILSQMALGEKVLYDVLPFRLSRFIGFSGRKSSL